MNCTYPALEGRELSEREKQVIRFLADGYSNIEIAELIFLSPKTVKTHLARVTSKLGARSRAHIVGICLREGLI